MSLAAGADQDHLRRTTKIAKHIGTTRHARSGRKAAAVQGRQRLPAQDQAGGLVFQLQDGTPALRYFIGVAGPQRDQPRHSAQSGKLFNGLMGWSILADTDRVVREDVQHRQLHDGG